MNPEELKGESELIETEDKSFPFYHSNTFLYIPNFSSFINDLEYCDVILTFKGMEKLSKSYVMSYVLMTSCDLWNKIFRSKAFKPPPKITIYLDANNNETKKEYASSSKELTFLSVIDETGLVTNSHFNSLLLLIHGVVEEYYTLKEYLSFLILDNYYKFHAFRSLFDMKGGDYTSDTSLNPIAHRLQWTMTNISSNVSPEGIEFYVDMVKILLYSDIYFYYTLFDNCILQITHEISRDRITDFLRRQDAIIVLLSIKEIYSYLNFYTIEAILKKYYSDLRILRLNVRYSSLLTLKDILKPLIDWSNDRSPLPPSSNREFTTTMSSFRGQDTRKGKFEEILIKFFSPEQLLHECEYDLEKILSLELPSSYVALLMEVENRTQ